MNKINFFLLAIFSMGLSANNYACSLSGEMAASMLKIAAIMKHVSSQEAQKDADINLIKMLGSPEKGEYVVELSQGTDCKAVGFKATILPSCEVSIQTLHQKFSCG